MSLFPNYIPVPEIFWSFETESPMKNCSLCDRELMVPGTRYTIEKAFKEGEVIFEHALCMQCHAEVTQEISTESMERIQNYFNEHVDFEKRASDQEKLGPHINRWIGNCLIKGFPQQECGEFQIYGCCMDEDLIFNGFPYMLSGTCIDEIIDLLSNETLGVLGDISEKLFGLDAPKDLLIF